MLLHWGEEEGTTPFPGFPHFTLGSYIIMVGVKQGGIKCHFWVVMTQPRIKPRSPEPLDHTLKFFKKCAVKHFFKKKLLWISWYIQIYINKYLYIYGAEKIFREERCHGLYTRCIGKVNGTGLRQFISILNNKLHGFLFKIPHPDPDALCHHFLPRFYALLGGFFSDSYLLRWWSQHLQNVSPWFYLWAWKKKPRGARPRE